jgi:hypothetical protein
MKGCSARRFSSTSDGEHSRPNCSFTGIGIPALIEDGLKLHKLSAGPSQPVQRFAIVL